MVTPMSLTFSLGAISCPLMLKTSLFFLLGPKNITWNYDGLALMPLVVYNSTISCRSLSLSNSISTEFLF